MKTTSTIPENSIDPAILTSNEAATIKQGIETLLKALEGKTGAGMLLRAQLEAARDRAANVQ